MSRSRIRPSRRAIALFATLTIAVAACHAGTATHATTADATLRGADVIAPALHRSDLAVLVADAAAARERGDWQNLRRFQTALTDRVGGAAIVGVRADYERAIADLRAAEARGDSRVVASLRTDLRRMCAPGSVVSAFEMCAIETTTWGR